MGNTHGIESRFLREPKVEEICGDDGRLLSVYVRLQNRKGAYATQPDAGEPVFIYHDADGFPIGVKFHAPVSVEIVVSIVDKLVTDSDGRPECMDRDVVCDFRVLPRVVKGLTRAAGLLAV